jgi:ABC-type dipeptide/oligopeptide/nickel transport system permease subunit
LARDAADVAQTGKEDEWVVEERQPASPTALLIRRLLRKRIAVLALGFIILFYAAGILAPFLDMAGIIQPYSAQNLDEVREGPSLSHPFGTDPLGRDQLSRVIWAAQTTVILTVLTLITGGLILSVSLGLIAGYIGGWVDTLIMRVGDIFACLPTFLILVLINATMKSQVRAVGFEVEELTGIDGIVKSGVPDYVLIFGTLSIFSWVGGARMIRAQILSLRETEFITAARAAGGTTSWIIFRHLLPNISNILIVSMSLGLAGIAGSEIGLTWFGIGIQPPHPSFGSMLFEASGIRTLNAYPHLLFFPALIVTLLFFSFNLLGDALTDVFTPRAR